MYFSHTVNTWLQLAAVYLRDRVCTIGWISSGHCDGTHWSVDYHFKPFCLFVLSSSSLLVIFVTRSEEELSTDRR